MTQASLGIGTILEYETTVGASPVAYTPIPEVNDIPPIPNTREFVEATNQDSGSSKEYIAGLNDAEQFTVEMNYIPGNAAQAALKTMYDARSSRRWRIRESGSPATSLTFTAFIAAWSPSFPVQGIKKLSITLRRTGSTTVV